MRILNYPNKNANLNRIISFCFDMVVFCWRLTTMVL